MGYTRLARGILLRHETLDEPSRQDRGNFEPMNPKITAVSMFSSGISSWAASKRYAQENGTDGLVLLFADTLIEDEDNYRFLQQAAENIGAPLVTISDGRDPFQVMRDEKVIGSSMIDPCSKILKRKLMTDWQKKNCTSKTPLIFGISWDEVHRVENMRKRNPQWNYQAPLCDPPYLTKADQLKWARSEGIEPPRMYDLGFHHANCGGFCIKAGQAAFKTLLREFPERYLKAETWEADMQQYLGEIRPEKRAVPYTILRETVKGEKRFLSLRELRRRIEEDEGIDEFDFGGCACALPL
jgi:3'-phosphoadenosine 5'-phosphosulfate sulfotransferase (PAPS reductase)/FAD synthetase